LTFKIMDLKNVALIKVHIYVIEGMNAYNIWYTIKL
jgi:hypothetical protein